MRLKSAILSALVFVLSSALFGRAEDDTVGPTFIKEPPNKIDFSNTTGATLECTARGNPAPEIIWLRGDGTAVGDVPGLRQVLPNGNLVFPPFRAEDYRQEVHAQIYICMARNSVGSIHSRDVNVRAVVNQYYEAEVVSEYVIRGNAAILKCTIPSFVADFVFVDAWISTNGHQYTTTNDYDGKYLVLPSGELHIRDVAPEDGFKSYQCRTKHKLTGETRLSATKGRLVITEPLGAKPPTLPPELKHNWVEKKSNIDVALLCQAQAYPVPSVRWYKFIDGTSRKHAVVLDDRVKQVSGTLIIQEAKVEDSGKYLCVVNNSVGGESVETVLTVTAPLSASVEPIVQTVDFGRPAVLNCNYEGNPVKTVSWLKDGKPMSSGEGRTLKIDSVRKDDRGMYQCFVRNEQESAQGSAEIKLGGRFDPPQITQAFTEEVLKEGPPVYLKCVASGNPTPEITWFLDSKKIEVSEKFQISNQVTATGDKISYLNISNVQTNDGGLYKCDANSKVGSASHSARLNVHGLPYVRHMEKQMIVAGGTLFVTCPFAGYPIDSVTWERDSRTLPINRKQKVFPNGTLIIENVERTSDQATYTCLAKSPNGYSSKGSLEVQVLVIPRIVPFSFEQPIFAGVTTQVTCTVAEGDAPLEITWSLHGSEKLTDLGISTTKVGSKVSVLVIENTQLRHRGNYTCRARNAAGSTNLTATLNINVPPRWILEPSDKAFAQGSDAKIECKADGFPRPQVTWKKATGQSPGDYKDLKNNSDIKVEDGTLTINNIQKSNEGYYLCEAVNGIGSGLSAVISVNVQAPPQFDIKLRNQTARKEEPAVLQCEAKGEKPIGIVWNMNNKRLDPKGDARYTIREEMQQDGVLSGLSIKRTERSDSALFTCIATNSFGSDDSSINLIIQEPPEAPYGLKVLNKSGRSVQMSWIAPYTGNSPINKYHVEYKITRGSWDNDMERVLVAGHETLVSVMTLRPATTYHFRIVAENDLGLSEPSEVVTIISAEEAPSGAPTEVRVEPVDQKTLKVFWKPPERSEWNGEIQGYYVGYKPSFNGDKPYVFETVEFNKEDGKEHHLEIHNLKTYTQYSVVVQAFNKLGPGPLSNETRQYTAEGIPEQPPHDTTCTTLTSQTIRVSWISPPLISANGIIKGYKVIFGPSETWFDESTKDTMITASSETILHGLKKYTNYSMEILAYTSGGDGVKSNIIHCQTDQDVPEPPSSIKSLVMSAESILVSWKAPSQPNGVITQYTVYYKEHSKEAEPKSEKVSPLQMNYEAKNLKKQEQYEFWVTASTNVGEGQPSKTITVAPNAKVPAKIASFSDNFTATYREDVKLPCLTVGQPAPEISWKIKGRPLESNERIRQLAEGSLLIKTVTRTDAGEYSCSVENSFGKDYITHRLIIHAPPHQPEVKIESTTNSSISILVKPHPGETEPIHGYTVRYKPDFGEAETVQVPPNTEKFVIDDLSCGMRYQIMAFAYNSIGNGDTSVVQQARTSGSKPMYPNVNEFITVATNSVTLQLTAWKDGGCPMYYFVIEYKKKTVKEWNQIANNVKPTGNYLLLDLEPANWYHLRVTAHNSAGFVVGEYEFATLTMEGSTISPAREIGDLSAGFGGTGDETMRILLANLNLFVPVASAILVIIVAFIVICFLRGKGDDDMKDDVVYNQSMMNGNTIDKRRPDLRDELGYIAPPNRKLPPVPGSNYNTCDRVKRGYGSSFRSHSTWDPRGRHTYEELNGHGPCRGHLPPYRSSDETLYQKCRGVDDEICPYATFHLLGFREEMDPSKAAAMQFQTFPHQNGHSGTIGPTSMTQANGHIHQRSGSQSMPRTNGRYSRVGSIGGPNSTFSPEYDDPANCGDEEPYGSQYGSYGAPYDHFGSRNSVGRRSFGSARNLPGNSSPEPPPPPPRNHDPNSSGTTANDSKESNEMSEAECDMALNRASYGVGIRGNSKDGLTTEEMRKLLDRNEAGYQQLQNGGFTTYDTVAV